MAASEADRLKHVGNRGANTPVLIGFHAGEDGEEALRIDRGRGAHRRRAHRRPVVDEQLLDVGQRRFALERRQRGHRLESHVRIGLLGRQDLNDVLLNVAARRGVRAADLARGPESPTP